MEQPEPAIRLPAPATAEAAKNESSESYADPSGSQHAFGGPASARHPPCHSAAAKIVENGRRRAGTPSATRTSTKFEATRSSSSATTPAPSRRTPRPSRSTRTTPCCATAARAFPSRLGRRKRASRAKRASLRRRGAAAAARGPSSRLVSGSRRGRRCDAAAPRRRRDADAAAATPPPHRRRDAAAARRRFAETRRPQVLEPERHVPRDGPHLQGV